MFLRRIRSSILKRPLCYSLAGFLLVFFLCGFLHSDFKLSFSIIGFYITLILIIAEILLKVPKSIRKTRLLPAILMLISISFSFLLSWINFDLRFDKLREKYHDTEAEVKVIVLSAESMSDYYSSHEVIVTEINGEKCKLKAKMSSSYFNAFDDGDTLRLPVKILIDTEFSNLSEAYDLSHGYLLEIISESEESVQMLDEENIFPYTQMSAMRKRVSKIVGLFTYDEGRALSKALLYGDRDGLSYSFTSAFKELGISHMLAISGMHFSIVVGLLAIVFSKIRINKKFSVILLSAFVLLYAFLAGFSGSVCRASVMLIFSYASFFFGIRSDAVTSLSCSAFIICTFNPYAIYDIGLLLSFFSTLGILTLALPINEKLSKTKIRKIKPLFSLISAVNITLSALLFTLPISYYCFGYISYISPITNLIFIPFITVILYLLPILIICSPVKALAYIIGNIITVLSKLTVYLATDIASSGNFYIHFDYFLCTVLLALMLISIALMAIFFKSFDSNRELAYIPLIVFVLGCYIGNYIISHPYMTGNSVIYYTENENDAIIISSGGESLFCDSSGGSYNFTRNAIEYAEKNTKTEISTYMISDYHYAHIATVTRLVEYNGIKNFILPIPQERDENFHNAITRFLYYSDCTMSFYDPNDKSVDFGEFTIKVNIYEHTTANPASLILIESDKYSIPDYAYISNARTLTDTNNDFFNGLKQSALDCDYLICGSHGDSDKALGKIKGYLSNEALFESFYSGIKE